MAVSYLSLSLAVKRDNYGMIPHTTPIVARANVSIATGRYLILDWRIWRATISQFVFVQKRAFILSFRRLPGKNITVLADNFSHFQTYNYPQ